MHSYFLSVSLQHQLSRVPALLRGHPPHSSYTGPAAVNCSTKIYYVQSRQRDSDHANKPGVVELRRWKQWAVVDILLWHLSSTKKESHPGYFCTRQQDEGGLIFLWISSQVYRVLHRKKKHHCKNASECPLKGAPLPLRAFFCKHFFFFFFYLRHLSPYLSLHLAFLLPPLAEILSHVSLAHVLWWIKRNAAAVNSGPVPL